MRHTCNPNNLGSGGKRISSWRSAQAKLVRTYLKKQNTNKRAGVVAQVVCQATGLTYPRPGLNPQYRKQNKTKQNKNTKRCSTPLSPGKCKSKP
jgi:hypothetical protein